MKKITIILMLIVISCSARIGETTAECVKRYGKPMIIDKSKQELLFTKNGFYIGAVFIDGKCEAILYKKMKVDALDNSIKISENEVAILMKSNTNKKWIEVKKSFGRTHFSTEDSNFSAVLTTITDRALFIMSKKYVDRKSKKENDKENNNLKGF